MTIYIVTKAVEPCRTSRICRDMSGSIPTAWDYRESFGQRTQAEAYIKEQPEDTGWKIIEKTL